MSDIFRPLSLSISQVFTDGDPLYKIPQYQRPYSWRDDQVNQLWEDVYESFKNNQEDIEVDNNYFLGSLIVVPVDKGFEDVVDGQQRITTLMILFNVIKTMYPEINKDIDPSDDPSVIKIGKVKSCIQNTNEMGRLRLFTHSVKQSDFDKDIINCIDFNNYEKPKKSEIEKDPKFRFINTAFLFNQKLQEISYDEIGQFVNYLFNKVKLIKIICDNRSFAIKLFQVLNDRGLDLSAADLIKSILMSKIKDDIRSNQFISDWDSVSNLASDNDTDVTQLLTYYQYYLLGTNPKKSLVDELEVQFIGKDSNSVMQDFKQFCELYDKELYNVECDREVFCIWYIPWETYWKTILLTALHTKYSEYKILKKELVRFYYLYWIAGRTLTAIKQTSFNVITAVKEGRPVDQIKSMLRDKTEADKVVQSALENLDDSGFYFSRFSKPVYLLVEYKQHEDEYLNFIDWNRELQLEHIMPQSFKNKEEWNHIEEEFGNNWLHSAGNLTLLSSKKNIEAQNYSLEEKVSIYKGHGKKGDSNKGITSFEVSKRIVTDYESGKFNRKWTEEAMISRFNWFIKEIGEILEIDVSDFITAYDK